MHQATSLISLRLRPADWLSAWRPETRRVHLPVPSAPKLREVVALRVQLSGPGVGATLTGSVLGVRPGNPNQIELAPDADSLPAARLLTAAARGEPVRYRERPLRLTTRAPVVVTWNGAVSFMTATSISEGGCALRWSGLLPPVGQVLDLRFGIGSRSADLRGVVRWRRVGSSSPAVGIRFGPKGAVAGTWTRILSEAVRSGAHGG